MASVDEQFVEELTSLHFRDTGIAVVRGSEIDDGGERGVSAQVMLTGRLGAALHRLNPDLPHDTVEEVVRILSRPPHPTLIQNNRWFHALLTDGVEVEYRDAEERRDARRPRAARRLRRPGRERAAGRCASSASPGRRARSSGRT